MESKKRPNSGLSSIFGSMLFLILLGIVISALFIALYQYDKLAHDTIASDQIRSQEKIIIDAMQNDSQTIYVTAIHVNNTGSTTAQIRTVYLDSNLLLQPTIDLNPKQAIWIQMPPNTTFIAESIITVTTEKGIRTMAKEGDFIGSPSPLQINEEGYFGPLNLDYESFNYSTYDLGGDVVSPPGWQPGWNVPTHKQDLVWQISVKDIDERAIALNLYSCLTLIPNKQGAQIPWYIEKIEHPQHPGSTSLTIQPQEIVTITYRWPSPSSQNGQSSPSSTGHYRVFLTFFGHFNELDGTIKPYGQSIPFEAVLIT